MDTHYGTFDLDFGLRAAKDAAAESMQHYGLTVWAEDEDELYMLGGTDNATVVLAFSTNANEVHVALFANSVDASAEHLRNGIRDAMLNAAPPPFPPFPDTDQNALRH